MGQQFRSLSAQLFVIIAEDISDSSMVLLPCAKKQRLIGYVLHECVLEDVRLLGCFGYCQKSIFNHALQCLLNLLPA